MKITASKLDDVLKQRAEYDTDMNKYNQAAEDSLNRLHLKEHEAKVDLEKIISDMIGPTTLQLEVRVDPYGRGFTDKWSVRVRANEDTKFQDKVALAWNWEATLKNNGEIEKDSGSWSGLKAITSDQIADLEESVRIIKLLNGIDWVKVLSYPKPNFDDYYDKESAQIYRDKKAARPNFEDQVLDSRLEELIDQNIAIHLSDDPYFNGTVGMFVTGQTDKFVKGYIFPWRFIENGDRTADELREYAGEPRRASKGKIYVNDDHMPVELNVL